MQVTTLICMSCKHFREILGGCDAFPKGIPMEIIETNEHSKPIEGQNNNIVFEKLDKDADI